MTNFIRFIAAVVIAVITSSAQAVDWKVLPGSICQTHPDRGVYQPSGVLAIRGGFGRVFCPLVRDQHATRKNIHVEMVIDKQSEVPIVCYLAYTDALFGGSGIGGFHAVRPSGSGIKHVVFKRRNITRWSGLAVNCFGMQEFDNIVGIRYAE